MYETKEEIEEKIENYFRECEGIPFFDSDGTPMTDKKGHILYDKPPKPPTVTGLALALGFSTRKSLLEYQGKPEFVNTITRAKTRIEEYAEMRLFDRDGVNGAKFSLINNFKKAWGELKTEVLKKYDEMKAGFTNFWDEIKKYYPEKIEEMKTAWAGLKDDFAEKIGTMKTSITTTMDEIKSTIEEKWGDIKKWFADNVEPKFKKEFWIDKFDGIKQGAKSVLNGIIGIVEKSVNGIIAKLNTLHWSIPDWVPGVGGKSFGFDIKEISIPRLATGAVIPPNQEFLAVLGDQKSGRNLEAPEGLIRQIMREELAGMMGSGDVNVTVEFTGSLAQLGRVLHPVITKEQKRIGKSLQTGGVL